MSLRKWLFYGIAIPFSGLILVSSSIAVMARVNHWSFNYTTCMPLGFYQRGPAPKRLKVGDRVFFCPPVHGKSMHQAITNLWLAFAPHGQWDCADHLVPFMKFVVALPGQTVDVTKKGVIANGKMLPNSQVVTSILDGKLKVIHLPYGKYVVPKGMFWDYAPGNRAYTSAYYGPVPQKNILGSIKPVPYLTIPGSQYWLKP
ncbi:conjugal transfer protein [Acidithiobacillus thiooxidans]|uniref:S26 family signal peptidase n=1 Tax=Acidithiobacillus thiooxidans TaxID=930 RepID=UPI001C0733BA|nr:conjugal transfer protein [Acidithiobacillus thiooxidans]